MGAFNSAHIFGTLVPVEEPSTASLSEALPSRAGLPFHQIVGAIASNGTGQRIVDALTREFIATLAGAVTAAPSASAGQQADGRGPAPLRHAQDTFYVGNLKGVGRVYQQTFIDTYAKVACAKLYDRKTPITAAELLNDRVLPFFEEHDVKLLRVLTDRGSEYCGNPERHEYELYLAVEEFRSSSS